MGRWAVVGVSTTVNALAWGARSSFALFYVAMLAVSGFGFGMRIAQLSTIPADAFAGPHLGAILGVVQSGGGLGGAIGPFLAGWLFDVTGSYRLAFLAACVAVAGSALAAWFAARPMAGTPARSRGEPRSLREERARGTRADGGG